MSTLAQVSTTCILPNFFTLGASKIFAFINKARLYVTPIVYASIFNDGSKLDYFMITKSLENYQAMRRMPRECTVRSCCVVSYTNCLYVLDKAFCISSVSSRTMKTFTDLKKKDIKFSGNEETTNFQSFLDILSHIYVYDNFQLLALFSISLLLFPHLLFTPCCSLWKKIWRDHSRPIHS